MGSQGLISLLLKHYPGILTTYYENNGAIVAIDASIFLYKSKRYYVGGRFIIYFLKMLRTFIQYNIFPIFVFDGTPSPFKLREIEKRRKDKKRKSRIRSALTQPDVKSQDYKYLKLLLDAFYIPYEVTHERDAEAFCAYLNRIGVVDHVITEDSDVILYGAKSWWKFCTNNCRSFIQYNCDELRKIDGIDFVDLYMLCGCDYTPRCGKPKDIYEKIKLDPGLPAKMLSNYAEIRQYLISEDFAGTEKKYDIFRDQKTRKYIYNFILPQIERNNVNKVIDRILAGDEQGKIHTMKYVSSIFRTMKNKIEFCYKRFNKH